MQSSLFGEQNKIFSVTEFNEFINTLLSQEVYKIQGEVSDFKVLQNKWVVFDLKDDGSKIGCFMVKFQLDVQIEDGMEIIMTGYPSIYVPQGRYSFRVQHIEPVGEGALKRAFELTKKKLEAEGLFDPQYKQQLPEIPQTIGLITSQDAAAYTDVLRILNNRWGGLHIYLYHAAVQGEKSATELVEAVEYFNQYQPVDVIIVTRGGGSLEDLQSFNSEPLCRAVFASKIPIIAAVGHERDVSLVELVADVRASTPSNAAEMAVPDKREFLERITAFTGSMYQNIMRQVDGLQMDITDMIHRLGASMHEKFSFFHALEQRLRFFGRVFDERVHYFKKDSAALNTRLHSAISLIMRKNVQIYDTLTVSLKHLNPRFPLRKGYSITRVHGKILRRSSDVKVGDDIVTELEDGSVSSRIQSL